MEKAILTPSSPQFSRLEYALQLSLKASTARIKRAYIVSNPTWTIHFDKRTNGIMTLDTWIDPLELTGSSSEEELMKRLSNGQYPTGNGVKVNVGKLSNVDTHQKLNKTMLYCRVGIGRAYCVDKATSTLPPGYDSFFLSNGTHNQVSTESNIQANSHVYLVKNSNQILPLYVATFEFDPMEEKRSRERPFCDNCEKAVAAVFCAADSAHLCKDCDVNLHTSKIAQRHQRTSLGQGADAFGSCRIHSANIEYFCSQCHVPVCIHCKMIGHHSSGEASKHVLVKVSEAFEVVLRESAKKDTSLDHRLRAIQKQHSALKSRGKEVENMKMMLESELERLYLKAKTDLNEAIERKRRVLMGDECELVRQMEEVKQLEEFLEYQRTAVDLYHLLFNWSTHQAMRESLREFAYFRDRIDVDLDLKIEGSLSVTQAETIASEEEFISRKSGSKQPSAPPLLDIGKLSLRKTSDFFAEALTGLDQVGTHERSLAVNAYDLDERSINNTTGYEDYC